MEHGRALREAAVAVGVFGPPVLLSPRCYGPELLSSPCEYVMSNIDESYQKKYPAALPSLSAGSLLQHNHLTTSMQMTDNFQVCTNFQASDNILGISIGISANANSNRIIQDPAPSENSREVPLKTNDSLSSFSSSPIRDGENDDDSIDVTNDEDLLEGKNESIKQVEISQFTLANPYGHSRETVYETSARLLFMAVKWAKNLPSFASLSFRDQVILLEESWSELFLLNAIQWCIPLDPASCALFSVAEHNNFDSNIKGSCISKSEVATDIRILHQTFCKFKAVLVDPAEFACLKAIVLFRPETRGLKNPAQIENLQDQAHVMLSQHTRTQFSDQIARFGRLLLMLSLLRSVGSHKIEAIYFHRTIGNTPMEKVLCDMYRN